MVLTHPVINSLKKCVLCWLATVDQNQTPNVSPKEIFDVYDNKILIANIASPQSVKNIKANPKVCVSFIDILEQKGFQVKGTAQVIDKKNATYVAIEKILEPLTEGLFIITSIIEVTPSVVKPILAPSYIFYPNIEKAQMVNAAKKRYKLE